MHWSGYSFLEATFRLLDQAFADKRVFTRFCLLSGVDYPIKPMDLVARGIARDAEQIRINTKIDLKGDSLFDRRIRRRYLGDNRFTNARTGPWLVNRIARTIEARTSRRFPFDVPIYKGLSWCCLTRQGVGHILDVRARQPNLVNWFRGVDIPDENLFHTLLMASPRAPFISQTFERPETLQKHVSGVHYVDFDNPNPGLPRTFVAEDYGRLVESPALFARKFSTGLSLPLLDRIDRELHGASPSA